MVLPLIPVVLGVGSGIAAIGGVAAGAVGGHQIKRAQSRMRRNLVDYEARFSTHLERVDETNERLLRLGDAQARAQADVVSRMAAFLKRHEKQVRTSGLPIVDGVDGSPTPVEAMAKLDPDVATWVGGVIGSVAVSVATPTAIRIAIVQFASASTGTAISALHGVAATNATMAALGGGALAAGGGGMALGATMLNVATVGPGILAAGLEQMGRELVNTTAFDSLTVKSGDDTAAILEHAKAASVNLRHRLQQHLGISLDETTTRADIETLWALFVPAGTPMPRFEELADTAPVRIPEDLRRSSAFLTHPVFNTHKSETAMLRYIRSLSDKDLALDRSMIPLGSCTMKLNATSEMIPITWPEFANIHPFAPAEQLQGYAELDQQLRDWLCEATGYAGISLQPNAGSQGEYAGLLAIKAFHVAKGEGQRNICLIPSSAHGTNPASAQMAGMQVVVTACDAQGNVDLDDLKRACEKHSANLAAVMITYPSTHGVFETRVKELCELVHAHDGRVYVDGANMNALVGVAAPGEFGGDVSHLNLHKTFCIPHGGGGPGVGPVCVVEDLVPFLPGHATAGVGGHDVGAVSAAPLGNAAVLPISWMYCRMMGAAGLQAATETAILSANYISARLKDHYPTLYASPNGHVAHECILDLRPIKDACGITAEDVAKRLIDYGFHAPTLSFPVPGTLMVEPTESEPLAELDRFIDAMIAIRGEIRRVEEGVWPKEDNPLKHAPHTAASLMTTEWTHPYSRELGAYPLAALKQAKYWSPIGRVDNVYGDRNLFCSCVPVGDYTTG